MSTAKDLRRLQWTPDELLEVLGLDAEPESDAKPEPPVGSKEDDQDQNPKPT